MKKIEIADIYPYEKYLELRKEFQKRIIKIKKNRRIQVGENITFVFENRDTVLYQIQEMIRLEKMKDQKLIQAEIDVYNRLIPDKNEVSATMLIEIMERQFIRPILDSLADIHNNSIFLAFDQFSIPAEFDEESISHGRISAVSFVKFKFNENQLEKFLDKTIPSFININHTNYKASVEINESLRINLIKDLLSK